MYKYINICLILCILVFRMQLNAGGNGLDAGTKQFAESIADIVVQKLPQKSDSNMLFAAAKWIAPKIIVVGGVCLLWKKFGDKIAWVSPRAGKTGRKKLRKKLWDQTIESHNKELKGVDNQQLGILQLLTDASQKNNDNYVLSRQLGMCLENSKIKIKDCNDNLWHLVKQSNDLSRNTEFVYNNVSSLQESQNEFFIAARQQNKKMNENAESLNQQLRNEAELQDSDNKELLHNISSISTLPSTLNDEKHPLGKKKKELKDRSKKVRKTTKLIKLMGEQQETQKTYEALN